MTPLELLAWSGAILAAVLVAGVVIITVLAVVNLIRHPEQVELLRGKPHRDPTKRDQP